MNRRVVVSLVVALSMPGDAGAEPYAPKPGETLHLQTSSTARTDGGTDLRLPPGYFLDEPTHTKLDAEMRRLQDAETRLNAENSSLRKSAQGISFGWKSMSTVLLVGIAIGAYTATR